MRILLAVPGDTVGGVTNVARNLAQYLHSRGHEIVFVFPGRSIAPKPKVTKFGFPGYELRMQAPFGERHPLISLSAFFLLFPITLFEVIRLVRRYKIDVVNIHFPEDCYLYFALCSRIFRMGLVSSIHGADVFPDGQLSKKHSWALRFLLRASNLIIAPSKQCRNDFVNAFPDLAAKTTFNHNGVDLARFGDPSREISQGQHGKYVLTVSSCKKQKALDVLIRAFQSVHEAFPLLNLILVGDGPLRGQLETLALSLGLGEQVKFLGYKTRTEVEELLLGCEVFVLPSRFETFGIAILEAMACEKPVIGTTAGGMPEIIENGKNGILVEPDNPSTLAEAILAVLRDETLQRTISKNGRATVERKFRLENTGEAYENAFYNLFHPATNLAYRPAP